MFEQVSARTRVDKARASAWCRTRPDSRTAGARSLKRKLAHLSQATKTSTNTGPRATSRNFFFPNIFSSFFAPQIHLLRLFNSSSTLLQRLFLLLNHLFWPSTVTLIFLNVSFSEEMKVKTLLYHYTAHISTQVWYGSPPTPPSSGLKGAQQSLQQWKLHW